MNTTSQPSTDDATDTDTDTDTITIPGVGEVTSPSAIREQNRSKYETEAVPVDDECPVPGCNASGYRNFRQLRSHFGRANDGAHRAYNLSIDDYRSDDE